MVSGLVTSPCDQLRIFSGDARLMRMASKSAITFAISNGLERNKVFLRFSRLLRRRLRHLLPSGQRSVISGQYLYRARAAQVLRNPAMINSELTSSVSGVSGFIGH